ncbi:hypothetical protein C8R44DRAFT_991769, partial [Mycena epipterygia]
MRAKCSMICTLVSHAFSQSAMLSKSSNPGAPRTILTDDTVITSPNNRPYVELYNHRYITTAPLARNFSCDWDKWHHDTFFLVPPWWHDLSLAEITINVEFNIPGKIIPLAFMNTSEEHFVFEADNKYYYYDGAGGIMYHYPRAQFTSRDDFL